MSDCVELAHVEGQEFIIITGLSGAGKSQAMKCLEDLDFFCVDNLPPALIPKFAELCGTSSYNRLALGIDVRGRSFFLDFQEALNQLPPLGFTPKIVFLEASEAVLVRRFSETRRRHPLASTGGVLQSIQKEVRELSDLRNMADRIIDTSNCSPHKLIHVLTEMFESAPSKGKLAIHLVSFGFKHGLPADADLVFDVRFIANPYYVPELRRLNGLDAPVRSFVLERNDTKEFLEKLEPLLIFLLPRYHDEGKQQVTLAVGCTGGQHRSTAIAERLARSLRREGYTVSVQHRDLEQESQRVTAV